VWVVPSMTVMEGSAKEPVPVMTGGVMGGNRVMVSVPWVMVVGAVIGVGRVKMPEPEIEVMTLPGILLIPVPVGTGGRTVNVVPPLVMVVGAVTVGRVKSSPFWGSVTTDGVEGDDGGGVPGRTVRVVPPVVMVVGAVTLGRVNSSSLSGSVTTDGVEGGDGSGVPEAPGGIKVGAGGSTVRVVPPVVMVVGAVTLGRVKISPFSGSVTTDDVGAITGGWFGGGLGNGGGGSAVSVVPPVTMVLGAVTGGNVNTSLLGSVVVMPGVPLPGPGGVGGEKKPRVRKTEGRR
jgi:hypothetical protein